MMKKFNKTVQITVEVDSIAEELLSTIRPEFPHRELLAETIVGNLLNRGRVSNLFNSLKGYRKEFAFSIGEEAYCSDTYYANGKTHTMGKCKIVEVNEFSDSPYKVEYQKVSKVDGETVLDTLWVEAERLSKVSTEIEIPQI